MVAVERFWVAVVVMTALPAMVLADDAYNRSQMNSRAAAQGAQLISDICKEYWEGSLRANPTMATTLGDRRYDDRLDDNSPIGILEEQKLTYNDNVEMSLTKFDGTRITI